MEVHLPETASQMPNALAMPVEQLAADVQRFVVSGWDGPDRQKAPKGWVPLAGRRQRGGEKTATTDGTGCRACT